MEIRELQLLQLDVMKEIHEVCIKHKIEYYLIAGSVLGAVRHGGFIPWDDDIDIAMMRSQYDEFRSVFYEEFDQTKYFLQDYDTDNEHRPALMRLCIKGTIQDLPYEYHLKNCKNNRSIQARSYQQDRQKPSRFPATRAGASRSRHC